MNGETVPFIHKMNDWKPTMNTTYLSLGQAAKETGKSKGTISKALSSGRLSYVRKEGNQYQIDPAELFRVFPQKKQETAQNERLETPVNANGNSVLEKELELVRERLKEKDEIIADLRQDRDLWRQQATNLLTDQREKSPQKDGEGFRTRFGRWIAGKS